MGTRSIDHPQLDEWEVRFEDRASTLVIGAAR